MVFSVMTLLILVMMIRTVLLCLLVVAVGGCNVARCRAGVVVVGCGYVVLQTSLQLLLLSDAYIPYDAG